MRIEQKQLPACTLLAMMLLAVTSPRLWAASAQQWVDKGLAVSESQPNSQEEADCYRKALKLDPSHASARFNLAYVLDYQATNNWHGSQTSWQDVGRMHEAMHHYCQAAASDPSRKDAYANALRLGQLLLQTRTRRPPDLYTIRSAARTCQLALNKNGGSTAMAYEAGLQDIVSRSEQRLASLKQAVPSRDFMTAAEIENRLRRRFTRGASPYQGPRVPLMIQFDVNRHSIRQESVPQLREMAKAMKSQRLAGQRILIEGHADSSGAMAHNQQLSERRADSVKRFLVNAGIDPERIAAVGFGEERPLVPNDSQDHKAMNRRVEFVNAGEQQRFRQALQAGTRSEATPYDVLY